jgi:hypothetical protein
VTKALLFGNDGYVILAGVPYELPGFGSGQGSARRGCERAGGVLKCVFKIRRINVDLVSGKDADLFFLEFQAGHRPPGEIVIYAAKLHRRPIPDNRQLQAGSPTISVNQLLYGLSSVENAG